MAPNKGFVKLYRKVADKDYWPGNERREFTKFEAWIDVILKLAAGLDNGTVSRGEFVCTWRGLSRRWLWSHNRVSRFMRGLEAEGELKLADHSTDQGSYHVTVTKYNTLNPLADHPTDQGADHILKERGNEIEPNGSTHAPTLDLSIPLKDGTEYLPTVKDVREWSETYACDVVQELKRYRQWALSNPQKRKTRAGIRKSICYWLGNQRRGSGETPGDYYRSLGITGGELED